MVGFMAKAVVLKRGMSVIKQGKPNRLIYLLVDGTLSMTHINDGELSVYL